ncbi:precorrin-4 C(11)-methyltransferase [Trichlorobacter lovleyi]|uniref:Precorrin-4 C11-methyltransferase n=1 Tax=Trichlorobacter lovleyi (strain ATCC BAA-1151 / DSM 17278 / SZ) TaxID=398767 RepID=B3EBR8_TRIL1|nr:precorrin-4 C(11)-methyltransferase [Trichlorobacter lovleyi]ACD97350.1 precorrin-4 C11-methyltransferase [Trichlorobacter lovleyi SZ]
MMVYFVGAGPGDPELLTRKAERLLRNAAVCIYAGSLVNPDILTLLPPDAERHDSASMTLEQTVAAMRGAAERGLDTIRLHSGEPALYGAIREQMNLLDQYGISYQVVPGISAFQAAAAALTTELTAPEVSQTVILTRTAGRTPMPEKESLEQLAASRSTLCIYLSTHKIDEVSTTLTPFYGPDCPVAVVYHASWPDQQILRGTLVDIARQAAQAGLQKTALIVVGHALGRDIPASKLYDAAFSHEYRIATEP